MVMAANQDKTVPTTKAAMESKLKTRPATSTMGNFLPLHCGSCRGFEDNMKSNTDRGRRRLVTNSSV